VPTLRNALDDYREAGRAAARAKVLASTIRESLPELRGHLVQLSRTIQRVEQSMKGPEKAIEAIVREVGLQGPDSPSRCSPAHFASPSSSPSGR